MPLPSGRKGRMGGALRCLTLFHSLYSIGGFEVVGNANPDDSMTNRCCVTKCRGFGYTLSFLTSGPNPGLLQAALSEDAMKCISSTTRITTVSWHESESNKDKALAWEFIKV